MPKERKKLSTYLLRVQLPATALLVVGLLVLPKDISAWTWTPAIVGAVASMLASRMSLNLQKRTQELERKVNALRNRQVQHFVDGGEEKMQRRRRAARPTAIQFWLLFRFALPGRVQRECFEPAFNDLLVDYVRARKFRGTLARRWIAFAFTLRTLFMVADCLRVLVQSGTGKMLLGLLPEHWRNWWKRE